MNFWQLTMRKLHFSSPPKPPPPPSPTLSQEEMANQRKKLLVARGMSSTILTGGQGVLTQAPISRTTLTGM